MQTSEIESRKKWLGLTDKDADILSASLKEYMLNHIDKYMNDLYAHFLDFCDTKLFFPNEEILQRAKSQQRQYFLNMVQAKIDQEYVERLLKTGKIHHKIHLEPKWYIGAYGKIISDILPDLIDNIPPQEIADTIKAFIKTIFFDISLVTENYILANEEFIIENERIINNLKREKEALNGLYAYAPVAVVNLDKNFNFIDCNEKFAKLLNLESVKACENQYLFDMIPELSILANAMKDLKPLSKEAFPLKIKNKQNTNYFNILFWPVQHTENSEAHFMLILVNVTDSVLLQQQRDDFVATLTHDLKTPILAANRILDLFINDSFGKISAEQKEVLVKLLDSNNNLYKLVINLLDIYRYESKLNRLNKTQLNVNELVKNMVSEIKPLFDQKSITITENYDYNNIPNVLGDYNALKRVVQNLLDNAIKFTSANGSVTTQIKVKDDKVYISIQDTGCGINQEILTKLFDRFWKSSLNNRNYSGAGLGLYLSRQIIEEHGGKIWCESIENQGSTFFVTLNHTPE